MSKDVTLVIIRNLEVLARIGVHGHEHGKPQPVRVNVWLTCRTSNEGDKLESVVDYEAVADAIRTIVASGHINLAESLAERIASFCLEDKRVEKARIRVEKLHALQGTESAGVEIERGK
jgi:7,8-dihydroneopterin aldolase/epimerase/oxygenase